MLLAGSQQTSIVGQMCQVVPQIQGRLTHLHVETCKCHKLPPKGMLACASACPDATTTTTTNVDQMVDIHTMWESTIRFGIIVSDDEFECKQQHSCFKQIGCFC